MNTPDTISNGRYRIEGTLGRGAQGTVYLARDTHLERAVALKSVGRGRGAADRAHRLLAEARALGQLNHPHLATVFDALEHDGSHYLVLEYVDGETVDACLRRRGALDRNTAAEIALQVLDGLAHAHDRNIVHRDVKPSNVVIDRSGKARLIDFGIAVAEGTLNAPAGTPQYAAPEALDEQAAGKAADVFSMSLVLYEMLTGRPAVAGASPFEIMHKIANLPIPAPSSIRPDIDERLDDIVLKGLIKKREDRYPDALAMHRALQSYLHPEQEGGTGSSTSKNQRALDFVLMRMRVKSSFPALSRTISTINRIAASDDESMQTLATALLKDFSLTNKLLRMVNSSTYGQFGGNISTISRAVMILGFDTVRNLAVTLILLEHLQNRHQAGELRSEVVRSLFNGITTRRLLGPAGGGDAEEGFICGVFFNLGRLLAMYYLYDEWIEIGRRMRAGASEHDAACAVLGLSLEELGTGVARSWNLPERMVRSMERITGSLPQAAGRNNLRIAANVGDMLCRIASHTEPGEKARHLDDLVRRCRPRLQMTARDYAAVVEESVEKFNEEARLLINDHSRGPMLETIRIWSSGNPAGEPPAPADGAAAAAPQTAAAAAPDDAGSCTILTAGIQDITSTLVNGCSLNDVLHMVLETMYRGIGFDRVLLALREPRGTRFSGRFGFGTGNEDVVKAFCFDMHDHSDVFQLAAGKCVDLVIADSTVDNIRGRIPEWHHRQVRARSFIVLPLAVDKRCVGLLYGDRLQAGSPAIGTTSMGLLKTLRNQAVLAFRQR